MRTSFEVNAMGPLRCVQALLPSLKKGSKVSQFNVGSFLPS